MQLKRRADLIPTLVETVKGYAAHERAFSNQSPRLGPRRSRRRARQRPGRRGPHAAGLEEHLRRGRGHPQLQASQNFLQLQSDLVDTENKIQAARRFFNGGVRELNTKIQIFPNNIFAKMFWLHGARVFRGRRCRGNFGTAAYPVLSGGRGVSRNSAQ